MQGHGFGPWRGRFYMRHGVGPHPPQKKPQPLVATWLDLESESQSHSVVSNSLWPHEPYSPWNSPGQNTGVGSLSLLQGIFPAQGSNPDLPHCRRILYRLSHQGSLPNGTSRSNKMVFIKEIHPTFGISQITTKRMSLFFYFIVFYYGECTLFAQSGQVQVHIYHQWWWFISKST